MNFQKIKKDLQEVYDDCYKDWGTRSTDSWGLDYLNKFSELAKTKERLRFWIWAVRLVSNRRY